jgi:hypothetical protein
MVEIAHLVHTIVTFQTGIAELLAVGGQEICVLYIAGVACETGLEVKSVHFASVAGPAGQRLVIIIESVTGEAETGSLLMRERLAFQDRRFPAFGRMAVNTILRVETLVNQRLAMAFNTIHRRVFERIALLALRVCWMAYQGRIT